MIKKKISLEEKAMFVKRRLVKKEINKDSVKNIGLYGIVGGVLGFGFLGTSMMLFGEDIEIQQYATNSLVHIITAIGTMVGVCDGLNKFKTTIDYYDDGLYDDGNINSELYDKGLYNKAIKKEINSFEERGYIISKDDLNKKSKGIVYDDGMKVSWSQNRMGKDKFLFLRSEKILGTLKSLKKNIRLG